MVANIKIKMLIGVLIVVSFLIGFFVSYPIKAMATYSWDSHQIAGGLYGSEGIPLKVASDGSLYLK